MIQWLTENQEFVTLLFTGVVALSTVVYAVLTAVLTSETRAMRKAQTEPKISVYFEIIEEYVNFGHLFIENIGLGPAYDIGLQIKTIGSGKGGELLIKDFSRTKFIEKGISYLRPGQKMKSGLTDMREGFEDKIKAVLEVQVSYRTHKQTKLVESTRVDFSEFEGIGRLGEPHLYSIAKSLKKIQEDLHHLYTGFHKLKVDTYNQEDRDKSEKEWEKRRNEAIERSKNGSET